MAITKRVQQELVEATPTAAASLGATTRPTASAQRRRRRSKFSAEYSEPQKLTKAQRDAAAARSKGRAWTAEEHARFLEALEIFPAGPWKAIANHVGTKNSRQTMTHAQKCREKHERKTRVLRKKTASKKKTKKPLRIATQRQPSRRRASTPASVTRQIQECEQESTEENNSDLTDQGEDLEYQEEDYHEKIRVQDENKEDMTNSLTIVLDEATFFTGCDDALAATTLDMGSPPLVSLLSLPDTTLFSSDDLWHSPSLAEVALGVGSHLKDERDDEHDADLHEFAVGLSQECW